MGAVWERRECVSAEVEDALVLLDLETLAYHSLNPTAAAVWEMLAEPSDERALIKALCTRYAVDEPTCEASLRRLLGTLEASRLIRPHALPGEPVPSEPVLREPVLLKPVASKHP